METQKQIKILPTFGGSFEHGWKTMFDYFLVLLLVVIVMGIILFPAQLLKINIDSDSYRWWKDEFDFIGPGTFTALGVLAIFLGILALIYTILVVPVFKFGADIMFVHAARGTRPEFETLIKGFKENYLHIILASLLTIALTMMATILLIVPGIIVACRLVFVSYLVMDRKLDPIIAVEESWRLTRGNGWTIFAMGLVSFFIYILGFAMLFIGIIPATMWVKSSFASLYEAVITEKNGAVAVTE
ncbi:MAG TPA: hypothetical protein VJ346_04640 [Bacteroidales bacterium]|nr:hypothetical protein [Bacteroidales bacterium]